MYLGRTLSLAYPEYIDFSLMLKLGDDIPTSNVLEFISKLFLFVRFKSIHRGFLDWKQEEVFIKLSRLNNVMKPVRYLLEVVK